MPSATVNDREPRRAREPDQAGVAVRDGVRLAYEVFSPEKSPTVLLMPTWSLFPSRFWKAQVHHLARHYRVVTFDGRGSGGSDRPEGAAAYEDRHYADDALAVLDATHTDRAVLVGFSCGAAWSVLLAADHPDRVLGLMALSPTCGLSVAHPERENIHWDQRTESTEGWAKYTKHYWLEGGYDDFRRFFFGRALSEPHSTVQTDDARRWSEQISPQTLADTTAGRLGLDGAVAVPLDDVCARVRCPVTVVHGTEDLVRPWAVGERLAQLTGGSLLLVEGGGHGTFARDPVMVNRLITDFVDRCVPPVRRRTWVRALRRPRRALYLSSPIGLGHARRDVAIARELRALRPDLEIDWLAQHPVTQVLEDSGERIHPASAWLAGESAHVESESGEHDLHAFQAIRRMNETLVANFMIFDDVVSNEHYDLVIGDEAWDVDYFLHENPELKRFAFAWMTDFVGWLPMPDGGEREAALAADHNAEMIEQRARFRRLRDASIFVGDPDDVVDDAFGPGLPGIREWTEENFEFAGYVRGTDSRSGGDGEVLRRGVGIRPGERLCVVTVGGSGVGAPLLHRVMDAVPVARALVPDLRFLIVTGPRIDPATLPRRRGAVVRGYVPALERYLAACDVAVVQGGLTTCMELTASSTPFVYVPLRHHFEQNFHVRHRLERYGAGRCLDYAEASDPTALAEAIAKELVRDVAYRPVETDGAARAAAMLAELM